jgi:hypothetical protein
MSDEEARHVTLRIGVQDDSIKHHKVKQRKYLLPSTEDWFAGRLFRYKTVDSLRKLGLGNTRGHCSLRQELLSNKINHHVLLLLHKWIKCFEQGFQLSSGHRGSWSV